MVTDGRSRATRGRGAWLSACAALAALVVLLTPTSALASGCKDSWRSAKSGSWFEAANWSTGEVPTAEDEVCIKEPGEYTVTMPRTTTVTVKALTLGAASGAGIQKLSLESTCGYGAATLTTTKGLSIGARGTLNLTSVSCGYSVTLGGAVSNAGSILVEEGAGGARYLEGNIVNTGTVSIANGARLDLAAKGVFTNGPGGKVVGEGTGSLRVIGEETFREGAGETSGSTPVVLEGGSLVFEGKGKSSFVAWQESASTISGTLAPEQSLKIEGGRFYGGSCGCYANVTAASGFTNEGSISLTSVYGGYSSTLAAASGTLTNKGSILVEEGAGGARYLEGNIVNTGVVALSGSVSAHVEGAGSAFTNEGKIEAGEAAMLALGSSAVFVNATGGSISGPAAVVRVPSGATFREGAGETSGSTPVVLEGGSLVFEGKGKSSFVAWQGRSVSRVSRAATRARSRPRRGPSRTRGRSSLKKGPEAPGTWKATS
jgi:hypothetical protein